MSATAGCTPNPPGRRKKHIWWRVGVIDTSMPSGRRSRSAQSPPQLTTTGASMSSDSVRTPITREPATRIASTRRYWMMVAPRSRARFTRAFAVDDGSA